jgi:hypothetical protein
MDQIIIKDKTYVTPVERFCYPINEHIGIVPFNDHFKIFRMVQGKPFIKTQFATLEDAVKVAKMFDKVYKDWFPIWENPEYVDANLPSLLRWTVENGLKIYDFVRRTELYNKPIRL